MSMSMFEYASYVDRIQSHRSFYDPDEDHDSWWLQKKREKEERQRREYEENERIRKEKEKQRIINSYPKFRILFIDGFKKEHVIGEDLYNTYEEAYDYMKFALKYDHFPRWYNKSFNRYITPPYKESIIIQQVEYGWNTSIRYNCLIDDIIEKRDDQYIEDMARLY